MIVYLAVKQFKTKPIDYEVSLGMAKLRRDGTLISTSLPTKTNTSFLEKLKEFDYAGIDEGSKIQYFNQGITDPALNAVKALLAANASADTFDEVVEAYKTYITREQLHTKSRVREVNVSAINCSTGNRTISPTKLMLKRINMTRMLITQHTRFAIDSTRPISGTT